MAREISSVGVVGLGTMGAGIVEVLARTGLPVVAVEVSEAALEVGRSHVDRSTSRALSRGRLSEEDRDALLGRIAFTASLEDLAGVDLVVEAVPERLDLKRELFTRLDAIVGTDAVLATNTSSLSVTEIAVATGQPHRVVGMHFFNPAPVLRLVEVVRTVVSDGDVVDAVTALARRLGKEPVVVRDRAGFIANALLFGYLNHAVTLLESGYATREDIDAAMHLAAGLPMGPLALLDLIGLDTSREILAEMYRQSRDRLHAPAPLLGQLVTAGMTGRKSGRGFYTYAGAGSGQVVDAQPARAPDGAREVRSVAVVGEGPDAARLAQLLGDAGYEVVTSAVAEVGSSKGVSQADLVVVAAAGGPTLFAELDDVCRPGAVLASATPAPSIVELAAATTRPADVVGMHVVAPHVGSGHDNAVTEVVHSVATSDQAVATVVEVCRRVGLRPVACRDGAGFLVARLLVPHLNDAVRMLEASYASADAIDIAMTKGCGYPVGPFEMLGRIGLGDALAVQRRIYDEVREPGFAPAPLLEQLVAAGRGFREG